MYRLSSLFHHSKMSVSSAQALGKPTRFTDAPLIAIGHPDILTGRNANYDRWQAAEIGSAVDELLAKEVPAQKVYGS